MNPLSVSSLACARILIAIALFVVAVVTPTGELCSAESIEFNRDIRPLLAKHCYACHGLDSESREGELRLDERAAAIKAGAIVPNTPEKSELIARIESDDPDEIMPPAGTGHVLTKDEIATLRKWIAAGAEYQEHWAFVPPEKSSLPTIKQQAWPRHELDHFVLAALESNGLKPTQSADRVSWLRRVSLDLTGLPPTPEESDAFQADTSKQAYENVVDRLLASEAYGEHWARMWLDLARYADTRGYEKDKHRDIWRYRDWVIDAFNRDMPFDQFSREQLAGDLLPDRTSDQVLATAFHRNTMTNDEGGTDNEEFRVLAVKDRVDTTVQVWMGLTMGCAKCHSHKYDPITNHDYYAFFAYFNQTQDADNEHPFFPTPTAEQAKQIAALKEKITHLKDKNKLKTAQAELKKLEGRVPKTPVMLELAANKQRKTRLHKRGNFLDQGEEVKPAVMTLFGKLPDDTPANRVEVANWLMQQENPLTARVMVNRLWARLFGIGLVETEEDFGTQGLPPSHPQLLDWLAVDFRENGWSVKKLLRAIALSSTYRQSSQATEVVWKKDPRNRLLSRGPRFRLPAETVRDQALAISGLLTRNVGGPSVMPPQPGGVWKTTYNGGKWKNAEGPNRFRRGLYTYLKRTSPYPAMTTFDAGSGEVCQIRRVRTNTPLQALVTLNDTAFIEAAGALAARMQQSGKTLEERLASGFRLVLLRAADPVEIQRLVALYESLDLVDGEAFKKTARQNEVDPRLIAVANVLLNLDETLMKP